MNQYHDIDTRLAPHRLCILGGFHPGPDDTAPAGCRTLLMIGPVEPGYWAHVTAQPEFADGKPDPVDRWSRRIIGRLACDLGGKAIFPFGGPPYQPFITWAQRTGRTSASPVSLLVHDTAGLMVSFRGALALKSHIALPAPAASAPCIVCAAPCQTACPVNALTAPGYDTDACHSHLRTKAGSDCLERGCRARRACPLSQSYGRTDAQSAYHMAQFHRGSP